MNIFICGDSTAQTYHPAETLMVGWGQLLGEFLPGVAVHNHAMAGRSTKSFLAEGRLQAMDGQIGPGDLLIVHSVSGRNGVPVEMALEARRRGVWTAAVTNLNASRASASRHPSGQRLFEVCDLVIDDCGCVGDAAIDIEGFRGRTAATSTVTGAAIVNAFCAEVVGLYVANGLEPPVFMSANVDGGDEYNDRMMERYKDKITYQG